jgi:hypothetical protein
MKKVSVLVVCTGNICVSGHILSPFKDLDKTR